MRQVIKILKQKLRSPRIRLLEVVPPHARPEIRAALWSWQFYPAYIAVLVLIAVVVLGELYFVSTESGRVEGLRRALSARRIVHEAKLEQKKQRLAIALSHLDDNPDVTAPDNRHSLLGQFATMEWNYRTKDNSTSEHSEKHSVVKTGNAETPLESQENLDKSAGPPSPKHSIVEMRDAETPLDPKKFRVTGTEIWYRIKFLENSDKPHRYLWRVIPADKDSSGPQRTESDWGPFSVFTIYPRALSRIKETKTIIIGSYSVAQLPVGKEVSKYKEFCKDPAARLSAGLSESDYTELCDVFTIISRNNEFRDLKLVVKRYSNIDDELIPDLKAGELDIAFGDISYSRHREDQGVKFAEYAAPKPILYTNDNQNKKDAEKNPAKKKLCTLKGTVYARVSEKLKEEKAKEYDFIPCRNIYDAIDKLQKNYIQSVLISEKALETINETNDKKLHKIEKSELLTRVQNEIGEEIGDDAFAMTDVDLQDEICKALWEIHGKQYKRKSCPPISD